MPTRTNPSQESALPSGQLPLDFSTPVQQSPPSRPQSSNAVREVPPAVAPARYLTRREAATYLRCSLRFLDGMGLPFVRKGRCKVYDRIDLDARMQEDKCRGRAWKETLWPVNVDSTASRIRGSGGLASFSRMDERVCQSTGCINRTDAESYTVRLKNKALEAGQQGLLGIFVWQQAVVRYIEEFADKRSLSDDKDHLKKLDPYLRSLKLDAIDMAVLQPFIRDRKVKDGVSNATINRALEVVRRILNVAHQDWRWLKGVPKIRMLKEPRRRVRFLRREEADRLIEALPEHMKPIVEFALSTGCRAGEILGLEWSRVDLNRKVAWLDHGTTKSGDGRGIPLNADAVAALESTRGQHPRWCFTFSGKRIHQSSTAWGLAKQRAGIEDFRFHDLRHTWASWHVQSGTRCRS
jgi:integrase